VDPITRCLSPRALKQLKQLKHIVSPHVLLLSRPAVRMAYPRTFRINVSASIECIEFLNSLIYLSFPYYQIQEFPSVYPSYTIQKSQKHPIILRYMLYLVFPVTRISIHMFTFSSLPFDSFRWECLTSLMSLSFPRERGLINTVWLRHR
jgi:hypothetical protein